MYNLVKAESIRFWRYTCAYPVESALSSVFLAILFYMLFLGASYMAGPTASFGTRLDGVVLSYVVWIIMQSTLNTVGRDLESEREHGTMEQLMMTTYGLTTIMLIRTWVEFWTSDSKTITN